MLPPKKDFLTRHASGPERPRVEDSRGMLRFGPVHYNTLEEVEKFGEALRRIAAGRA